MKEIKEIPTDKKLYVIDFYADWCHKCRKFLNYLENLENQHKDIEFCKINVDICDEKMLNDLNVDNLPLIIALKKGKEMCRYNEKDGTLESWLHFIKW